MDIRFGDVEEHEVQEDMANLAIHNEGGPVDLHRQEQNLPNNQRVFQHVPELNPQQNPAVPRRILNAHQNRLDDNAFNADDARSNASDLSFRPMRHRGVRGGTNRKQNPYDISIRNIALFFANMVSAQTGITREQLREARDNKNEYL